MTQQAKPSAKALHALLPQTQCQLCEYPDCMAYATAISAGEAPINRCLPGGVNTLNAVARLTGQDPAPYTAQIQQLTKPTQTVRIDEDACIGCTKCIQACPVDAIIGRNKHMHTVIANECSGCELCIAPCPVDCIHIEAQPPRSHMENTVRAKQYLHRYQQHQQRQSLQPISQSTSTPMDEHTRAKKMADPKSAIQAILQRNQQKHQG